MKGALKNIATCSSLIRNSISKSDKWQ